MAVLLVVLAIGSSYVSYLPRYSIQRISIVGAQTVPEQLIQDYVISIIDDGSHHFFSRANIFVYPSAVIEKDIPLQFPRIASASVSRSSLFGTTLSVTVEERQPFALWCEAGSSSCYQVDDTGFLFAVADPNAASSTTFIFNGGISTTSNPIGQTFAPGHMPGLAAFLQLLAQSGYSPLGADVQSDEDFTVPLSQGFYIKASFGQDASQLVNNLKLVLSSDPLQGQMLNLEYVDLRFGDRVYYKLNGQSETQSTTQ